MAENQEKRVLRCWCGMRLGEYGEDGRSNPATASHLVRFPNPLALGWASESDNLTNVYLGDAVGNVRKSRVWKHDSSLYGDVASCLAHHHCHHSLHCHHGHHDLWSLHHDVIVIVIIMSGYYITVIFKQYRTQLPYLKTWHLQERMSCGLEIKSATRFVPFLMLLGLHFFPGKLRLGAIDDPSPERAGPSGGVKNIHLPIDWKYVWGGGQFCILPLWQQTMHGVGLNEQMGCRLGQLGFLWPFSVAYLGNNCALVTWSYFFLRESSLDSHSSLPPVSDFFPIKL